MPRDMDATAPALSDATTVTGRARWEAYWVCVAVAALTILDLSKVNVGLPAIEHSLHGGPTELQLIVAGYALAFGLALVPAGRLGDLHSRKLMFVIGLSLFTLASLFCAVAPNVEMLVVARILQGVAAGIQMPQVLGLVQQLFHGPERGRAFGVFGSVIGLSTAFGPTIGGLLIAVGGEVDGWRLLFWMNIPLGLVALVFAIRLLPGRPARRPARTGRVAGTELDLLGILLLGLAVFCLMLPFVLTTGGPDDDPSRWLWLAGFAVSASAFIGWERRYLAAGKSPVVDLRLFRLSSYRNGTLLATSYFTAMPAMFLISTLYLQQGLALQAVYAGMVTIPFALASAVTSWIGGRLVERLGRRLVLAGLGLVVVGFAGVLMIAAFAPAPAVPWLIALALAVSGAGGGFVISPNQTLTLAEVPVSQGGVAGSVGQVGQRAGTAVGVAACSSIFFATIYREAGALERVEVYADAFRNGGLVAIGFLLLAILFAAADVRRVNARRMTGDPEE